MLHWLRNAGCGPKVVKPRVHEDPVDCVHQQANLHRREATIDNKSSDGTAPNWWPIAPDDSPLAQATGGEAAAHGGWLTRLRIQRSGRSCNNPCRNRTIWHGILKMLARGQQLHSTSGSAIATASRNRGPPIAPARRSPRSPPDCSFVYGRSL